MNKNILSLGLAIVFVFGSLIVTSCGGQEEQSETEVNQEVGDEQEQLAEADVYQCPMQCEGDKTYHEAGSCPECGMDLEKISGDDGDGHDHDHDHDHDQDNDEGHDHDEDHDHDDHEHEE